MQKGESLYALDWFKKADLDLAAVETLLNEKQLEMAAFHVQQAIEKYLKGYLLSKGWKMRRIHDLEELLNEALEYNPALEQFRSLCEMATEFYIEERYPFLISSELTLKELKKILVETKELIKELVGG